MVTTENAESPAVERHYHCDNNVAVDVNECKEIAGNTGGATGPFRHLYLENELYLVQMIN